MDIPIKTEKAEELLRNVNKDMWKVPKIVPINSSSLEPGIRTASSPQVVVPTVKLKLNGTNHTSSVNTSKDLAQPQVLPRKSLDAKEISTNRDPYGSTERVSREGDAMSDDPKDEDYRAPGTRTQPRKSRHTGSSGISYCDDNGLPMPVDNTTALAMLRAYAEQDREMFKSYTVRKLESCGMYENRAVIYALGPHESLPDLLLSKYLEISPAVHVSRYSFRGRQGQFLVGWLLDDDLLDEQRPFMFKYDGTAAKPKKPVQRDGTEWTVSGYSTWSPSGARIPRHIYKLIARPVADNTIIVHSPDLPKAVGKKRMSNSCRNSDHSVFRDSRSSTQYQHQLDDMEAAGPSTKRARHTNSLSPVVIPRPLSNPSGNDTERIDTPSQLGAARRTSDPLTISNNDVPELSHGQHEDIRSIGMTPYYERVKFFFRDESGNSKDDCSLRECDSARNLYFAAMQSAIISEGAKTKILRLDVVDGDSLVLNAEFERFYLRRVRPMLRRLLETKDTVTVNVTRVKD